MGFIIALLVPQMEAVFASIQTKSKYRAGATNINQNYSFMII